MANHAYVIPKRRKLVAAQVNNYAQEIVKRKFPVFTLEFDGDKNWHLKAEPDDGYLGLIFWLDEYGDPKTWNPETEECTRQLPCIEFRHGHSYRFMWWVEYEIREELARLYNAWSVDDGTGDFDPPQLERFDTYKDYLVRTRWDKLEADPKWKAYLNREMDEERDALPEHLKHLIGERIE